MDTFSIHNCVSWIFSFNGKNRLAALFFLVEAWENLVFWSPFLSHNSVYICFQYYSSCIQSSSYSFCRFFCLRYDSLSIPILMIRSLSSKRSFFTKLFWKMFLKTKLFQVLICNLTCLSFWELEHYCTFDLKSTNLPLLQKREKWVPKSHTLKLKRRPMIMSTQRRWIWEFQDNWEMIRIRKTPYLRVEGNVFNPSFLRNKKPIQPLYNAKKTRPFICPCERAIGWNNI